MVSVEENFWEAEPGVPVGCARVMASSVVSLSLVFLFSWEQNPVIINAIILHIPPQKNKSSFLSLPSLPLGLFLRRSAHQALVWAAQGGGGVTVPGGVQETFRCCMEGRGLVGNIGDMWMVGLDELGGLFQPRILWMKRESCIFKAHTQCGCVHFGLV